ncbi:hypothetical protein HWV62_42494 [Athelia sp. TMB]|nr:hypothetical protein HWV62_42494 [Athelia sp. TMB]
MKIHKFPSFSDDLNDFPTIHLTAGPLPHAMRRRRSHLQRWIEDQHYQTHLDADSIDAFECSELEQDPATQQRIGTPCNPYLAYPHLGGPAVGPKAFNEAGSMHSYVVVDAPADGPGGEDTDHEDLDAEGAEHSKSSSLSTLNLSRPPTATASSTTDDYSPTMPRGAPWKWRPSVLNHFSSATEQAPQPQPHPGLLSPDAQQPPRPSMSSSITYMSSAGATNVGGASDPRFTTPPCSPSRTVNIDSVRSRNKSPMRHAQALFTNTPGTSSVPSLWSGPTSRTASHTHTPEASGSGSTPKLVHKESAIRILFSPKRPPPAPPPPPAPVLSDEEDGEEEWMTSPQRPSPVPQNPYIVYPAGSKGAISRLSMASLGSSRDRQKKKLVISGIAHGDAQRTTALRLWCETFGEVTRIVRMPNADLHVHFRKAEVAETGGPTITKLQHLLSTSFFSPTDHPDMILTQTSLSAPYHGTQLVYTLGERTDAAPLVRPLSVGAALARFVHLLSYLAPLFPHGSPVDLRTESRRLSYRDMSLRGLVGQLVRSEWGASRDAAPFDVTFAASDERDCKMEGLVNEKTYYRSFVASMTRKSGKDTNHHVPTINSLLLPPFYLSARLMGAFDFISLSPAPSFLEQKGQDEGLGEEYWQNDGVVPLFSQWHPLNCTTTQCVHYAHGANQDIEMGATNEPVPGMWHVYTLDDANHCSISPQWMGTQRQKGFWEDMGQWLANVEAHRAKRSSEDIILLTEHHEGSTHNTYS